MDAARSLLVECLLAAAGPRPALPRLAAAASGSRFAALARRWAVAETAGHSLIAGCALDALGRREAEALRGDLENATARNVQLLAEAAAIGRALRAAGIEWVALKGAALVAVHYPAVGARHVGDLDLLVGAADVLPAAAALRAAGCTPEGWPLPGLDGRPSQALPPDQHHLPVLRTPGGVACELHYALPGVPDGAEAAQGVLARAREAVKGGGALRVPSVDDLLGIACAHALVAHRADVRVLPRHVADVAVLIAAGADPERARTLCPGQEVRESLALVDRARAGDASALLPRGAAWPPLARGRIVLAAARRARREAGVFRTLFPARSYLASRYGLSTRSPWLPFLWAWRPIRALLRVATGR